MITQTITDYNYLPASHMNHSLHPSIIAEHKAGQVASTIFQVLTMTCW